MEALTPEAKDVVIILDVSQSMNDYVPGKSKTYMQLAKDAVITVLSTLSPRDRVKT